MSGSGEPFPQSGRQLSPHELRTEAMRLCELCKARGVEAVVARVGDNPELLAATAEACRRAKLIPESQYLDYCANPYD